MTAWVDNVSYDSNTALLTFNSTATGTKTTKVEFLISDFDDVKEVKVDGQTLDTLKWSVAKSGNIGIVTITDITFSERTFSIAFTTAIVGGGGLGGGGGGGGVVVTPPSPPRTAGALTIDIPNVSVRPGGEPVQFEISSGKAPDWSKSQACNSAIMPSGSP